MNSFYSEDEIRQLGFKSVGQNVLVSKKASIYGISNIEIGNNVRIDDFCILSGKITIHNYVHIAAGVMLFGGMEGIELEDYTGISSRTAVYAESDDYTGEAMTNPMVPDQCRKVYGGKVLFQKHSLIGTGCTVLPDVTVGVGASVGAMSLVASDLEPWGMYVGIPCKKIKERKKDLLKYEKYVR